MSRESFEAGLRGRFADPEWAPDELADYERGATLIEHDRGYHLAMWDREPIDRRCPVCGAWDWTDGQPRFPRSHYAPDGRLCKASP